MDTPPASEHDRRNGWGRLVFDIRVLRCGFDGGEVAMARYPAAETAKKHERILQEASRLFRENGFSAVSVGDLMKAAELTHGSFYNHFESKLALIGQCIEWVSPRAAGLIASAGPTDAGKRAFAAKYLSIASRDNPGHGCLMSSLGPEIAREPAATPAMTNYVQSFIGKLVSHFPWSKPAAARREAIRMTAAMVGALVLARSVDDEALSREILRAVAGQF
ncbi:TetR/AcrR family transcriptional regulator [Acidisphaera sp. L21]|uniref:TetR/AcrR family transcriptional regulator n=1 Tax=Acidisphaera sp. L21 TaxID=1641851 RepID=UPI00131B9EDC|nr:TetR/AcrR family transcriptional regulator [Acidisphaera sp. L21]